MRSIVTLVLKIFFNYYYLYSESEMDFWSNWNKRLRRENECSILFVDENKFMYTKKFCMTTSQPVIHTT